MTHNGAANFAVWSIDASGGQNDLLANVIGPYSGTVLFDEGSGVHSVAFDVDADGAWTIVIKPISAARVWDGLANLTGRGDDVVIVNPPSSGLTVTTIAHQGEANFAVWAYGGSGTDLLVNEIGAYSGDSLLADGTFLLEINADGSWSFSAIH